VSSPAPRNRRAKLAVVRRSERITPHMIRLVLSCDEFVDNGTTDHYVKLLFPKAGVTYPEPLDMGEVREQFPADQWPTMRTYTVRSWDEAARELTIDFVYHGDEGVAGPWAASAQPGDKLWFNGPGGAYAPNPEAAWHLLVGDESALPAIGAAIEQLPARGRRCSSRSRTRPRSRSSAVPARWTSPGSTAPTCVVSAWSRRSRNSSSRRTTSTSSSTAKPVS
jgi:NADPH-dependent ferric siderophore reductase